MKQNSAKSGIVRRMKTAWIQAKGSPFPLPFTFAQGNDPAAIAIHRLTARLFVSSRLGRLLQWLAFPEKWLRGNVAAARRAPGASDPPGAWLGHLAKGLWVTAIHNFEPATWYKYGMWRMPVGTDYGQYITHREICALLPYLNRDTETSFLARKLDFWRFCQEHGIPCAPIIAVATDGGIEWTGSFRGPPKADLFIKPEDLYCGIGAERWHWSEADCMWLRHGVAKGEAELLDHLRSLGRGGRALVQPRLVNHPEIMPFTNGSLATLRVVTGRVPGEAPAVMATCLRMPTGESEVDNFAAGGLAAGVSETGIVQGAVCKVNPLVRIGIHPDSHHGFEGVALPMFHEALRLCLTAHGKFAKPCFVGWDVAFIDSGPILLEANTTWCVDLLQMAYGRPVGSFGFIESYMRCVRQDGGPSSGALADEAGVPSDANVVSIPL